MYVRQISPQQVGRPGPVPGYVLDRGHISPKQAQQASVTELVS